MSQVAIRESIKFWSRNNIILYVHSTHFAFILYHCIFVLYTISDVQC
jgi:hypothetical protein